MRTNPPGEEREEGEGKKPTVVGEPGGLKKGKRHGDAVLLFWTSNQQAN